MTWFKPQVVYLCMKRLYFVHATTLTITIKTVLLSLVLLFVVDDFNGCSHLLMSNSRLDTIERLYETQHDVDIKLLAYKNELVNDMINYTPTLVSFGKLFTIEDNSEGRIQIVDSLTSALLPLILMLLVLWQFVRALFRKTADQIERLLNLALIIIIFLSFAWLIASISTKMPTITELPIINYALFILVNILVYILVWFVLLKNYSQENNS